VLAKLGPLDPDTITDLRPYLETVPDPRSRRGPWYSLTAILLVCACATLSGAKSIDELAEWGAQAGTEALAAFGIRHHLLRWRRSPSRSTIGRALEHLDGDALDRAVGAYLTDSLCAQTADTAPERPRRAIAVDGKALKGSARLDQARRHLLSALDHAGPVTIAGAEVGSKTNETRHFKPLPAPLDLAGALITFDALHIVQRAFLNVYGTISNTASPVSFSYRPGRSWLNALEQVQRHRDFGLKWVLRADIADLFADVDHRLLVGQVAERVRDPRLVSSGRARSGPHQTFG
jgi:hypothetical protein